MEDRYRVVIRKRVVVDRQDIYRIDNEIARRQINDRWKTDIGKIGDRCQLDRRKTPDYQKIDNRYIEDSISSMPPCDSSSASAFVASLVSASAAVVAGAAIHCGPGRPSRAPSGNFLVINTNEHQSSQPKTGNTFDSPKDLIALCNFSGVQTVVSSV